MTLDEVRIVDLPPMRVASALGYGTEPENQAATMIVEFARKIGLEPGDPDYRTFGFNNPNPSPGSPNYGYEIWLVVGPDVEERPPIKIKDVPGSRYAVTRFTGLANIGRVWRELVAWFEDSPYTRPPNWCTCLEEVKNPAETDPDEWIFDLYLPNAV
jgi:effector-binding domain-containing protein